MTSRRTLICRFAAILDDLRRVPDSREFARVWDRRGVELAGWQALTAGRRPGSESVLAPLEEVDGKLLTALAHVRRVADRRVATFQVPALERMQHASAAAVTAARWGVAGLRTVVNDRQAPFGRRYFAFLALAERHPPDAWPLFERYLDTPSAHHAFVAAAADAARYYGGPAVGPLLALFNRVRRDDHLRRFLAPHILESLHVLNDSRVLPFARELLTVGHTAPDPERCEITRALVIVRRLTGTVEASAKFADAAAPAVAARLDRAAALFDRARDEITSVVLI